jgi:hypothetical protein
MSMCTTIALMISLKMRYLWNSWRLTRAKWCISGTHDDSMFARWSDIDSMSPLQHLDVCIWACAQLLLGWWASNLRKWGISGISSRVDEYLGAVTDTSNNLNLLTLLILTVSYFSFSYLGLSLDYFTLNRSEDNRCHHRWYQVHHVHISCTYRSFKIPQIYFEY